MGFVEIINASPAAFRIVHLDALISSRRRRQIQHVLFLTVLFAGAFSVGSAFTPWRAPDALWALFFLVSPLYLCFFLLEFYYRANAVSSVVFRHGGQEYELSVEASRIFAPLSILSGKPIVFRELIGVFAATDFARLLSLRTGAVIGDTRAQRETEVVNMEEFLEAAVDCADARGRTTVRMSDILETLLRRDPVFAKAVFDLRIQREELVGAASWVEDEFDEAYRADQWWRWENLSRIAGIGTDLGYGYTYALNQYSSGVSLGSAHFSREARTEEIDRIESALLRSAEANVLLVGSEGVGKHAILEGLAERVNQGAVPLALEFKRMVVLDTASIEAAMKTKSAIEGLLLRIFDEAVRAGNIILVIENLPGVVSSFRSLGVDLIEIIEPFIAGSALQVIALADSERFHRELESNAKLMKLFEKIELPEPSGERVIKMLEDVLSVLEPRTGKIFTYGAVRRAADLAERFITEGAMPEKAIDILDQAAASAPADTTIVTASAIDAVVEKKTHIPTTVANAEEGKKLLALERLLAERVIGQEQAVRAIANALRRARSGLHSGSRPIGSFLFLGPTGVGKTETAKALAEAYFGGEKALVRFDMSEYQGPDGMAKLIGAHDGIDPGILSTDLRERPFSLLLFDEFEKASPDVQNLFLQILDEGFFSDGAGKRVSARETMIIATSNAGAGMIWDLLKEGKERADIESRVIDAIRRDRIFSPELLNRFDAVVVFHPLDRDQLRQVAFLLLRDLQARLREQEIEFEPTDELASKVVELGYDATFGARPMRRAIADHIEQAIAKKILEGTLRRGDRATFSKEEVASL